MSAPEIPLPEIPPCSLQATHHLNDRYYFPELCYQQLKQCLSTRTRESLLNEPDQQVLLHSPGNDSNPRAASRFT